jgi:hypothetical protein
MTLLLSASLVNYFQMITILLTGFLRWEIFTSNLGFFFSHKISYKVVWFRVSSFRRTPICFSREKHFKCDFKISDSLFHQTSPWRRSVRPGALIEIDNYSYRKSVQVWWSKASCTKNFASAFEFCFYCSLLS